MSHSTGDKGEYFSIIVKIGEGMGFLKIVRLGIEGSLKSTKINLK